MKQNVKSWFQDMQKKKSILNELKKADTLEQIFELNEKLQKLPRNSAPTRMRNRCWKTGRPRGFSAFLDCAEMPLGNWHTIVCYLV